MAAVQVVADDPALPVGHGPKRHIARLAGHQVLGLDAVAAGVNVRVGGLEVLVDQDSATLAHFQPRVLGDAGNWGLPLLRL